MKKLSDLPDHSRVWIYQANQKLSSDQVAHIKAASLVFLESWAAHGADLDAALEVIYDQFVVLSVDENIASATGCSIDKSVHFFQKLGDELGIDFFNRLLVAYKDDSSINLVPMGDFEDLLKAEKLTENTMVFNNLVSTLGEFRSSWQVEVKNSWHNQLLPA